MKTLVLMGGDSPERSISLRSGQAVLKALGQAGLECASMDPLAGLAELDELSESDVIFPILHGIGGEDGSIQNELEKRGLNYLGTRSGESRICFNKHLTREVLRMSGITVAAGEEVIQDTYFESEFQSRPHVLKAVGGGSSIGTLIVENPDAITTAQIREVFEVSSSAVIEELVEGVEITVPILGNSALPIIEIRPPKVGGFNYENKYNGLTEELCPPPSLDDHTQEAAKKIAEKTHACLGARHLSRVDMIVRPHGEIVVLEINTIPGMTDQSLYPKSAAVAGFSFPMLMKEFVSLVERDAEAKHF